MKPLQPKAQYLIIWKSFTEYIQENMQAGKRYFASLMEIQRKCKAAREELSVERKTVREKRNGIKEM